MRKLKLFFACLLMAVLSIGQMWAVDYELVYTLDGTNTSCGGSSAYDAAGNDVVQNEIHWAVVGNVTMNPWRIGGKSLTGVDRSVSSKSAISDDIAKVEITHGEASNITVNSMTVVVSKNSDFSNPVSSLTPSFVANNTVTINRPAGKDWSNCYYKIIYNVSVSGKSNRFIQFTGANFYKEQAASDVATPTFSPAAGVYTSAQSVTLSCETASSTIYYTTDGSDPDNTKTQYAGAINVDETTTIKAIAYVGSSASNVASATYTIVTPLNTMDAIFAAATAAGSTATDVYIDFQNWVVSGAKGNTAYVTDGTKGFIVYYSGHGFAEGDILSGVGSFKIKLYNGAAELTAKNSGTITATPGGSATLNVLDADGIAALSGINTGSLIKISGEATATDVVEGIKLYKTIYPASSLPSLSVGANYNCTGVYVQYSETKEMMPRSADDIEQIITTYTVTYNNAPDHGTLTIKNGDDVVVSGSAVNENTVLTIEATPAEGYKLTEVTVNGSAYAESTLTLTGNVTIAATFEVNEAPLVTSYVLSEIGVETSHLNGEHVGDKVNLPLTATECSKVFRGWDTDENCATEPTYAPGAEITLAANNKFYAVYADAHVVTPTDHALGSATFLGSATGGNTASEGYEFSKSTKGDNKAGYIQDSGTKDATIVFLQIKAESQIINEEPSAIILTAHLGAGSDKDPLDYPVYAVLVDADNNNVGDPVVLTTAIPKAGDDFSVELPTANYTDVRGVKISHMKEDGWNVRYYSMSFKYQTGGTTYDNYSTECQAQVATPVIAGVSPSGVYTEAKEITITCATDGATIYYAVDSDEEPSTEYTGAFTVGTDGAHTVKAKAVKTDMAASEIASVSFTINLPVVLSTIPAIFEAATSTQTEVNIAMDNWVVSGVGTDEKTVYVTDGTNGFIIYNSGHGFAVGDILSGTITCDLKKYKGAAELIGVTTSTTGLSVATGGTITPAAVAPADLAGVNTGALISLSSWKYDGSNLTNGTTEIQPYTTLYNFGETFVEDNYYNVSGIYLQFDSKKEILPRSADDIEEVSLSDPEISYTPASATIELGQNLPGTTFANPHGLEITFSSNNEEVATVNPSNGVITLKTETGTAVITASFAGNATYAAANVTYTITVTPASVTENVVILALYNTKYYAMPTAVNTSGACEAIAVEYDGSKVTVASAEDKAAIQWTRKTSGDNTAFQNAASKYLKGTSGGASLSLADDAFNWSWDATNGYYYIPGSTVRSFFYKNDGVFKNYAVSNLTNAAYAGVQVIVIDPANIEITSKVSAELAYNPTSDVITEGDAWSAPALVNPYSVTITSYATDNDAVATVTDGGVIALAGGIGTAHITAHFDGDASYLEGDAVYTITVNEAGDDLSGTWTLASSVAAGDKIIIANVAVAGELLTMGAQNGSYREQVASTVDGENKLTPAAGTKVFTLVDASSFGSYEGFALQASNGNYLSSASNSSNNIKEVASVSDANAVWSIVISEGVAAIVAQGSYARKVIRYNSGNTRFSCYAESNTMADVVIYKHGAAPEPVDPDYTEVRNGLTEGWYYTMCLDKAVTAVKAGSIWKVLSKAANGNDVILEEAELPLVAGRPYIFRAAASTLEVAYTGDAVGAPVNDEDNNGLVGAFEQASIAQAATNYIIYNNALYFVNSPNVYVGEHRAYLDMTGVPAYSNEPQQGNAPRRRVTMAVHGEQTTTGIDALNASETPVKMMINGQLFILRGEKMYDATGRLVK